MLDVHEITLFSSTQAHTHVAAGIHLLWKQIRKKLVSNTGQIVAVAFVIIFCYVFIEACTAETHKNTLATKLLMATAACMHL